MNDNELDSLLQKYEPLCQAELDRIGIDRKDQRWIHAGTDVEPTAEAYEDWLTELRSLPTGWGPVAYCKHLGFDYDELKARIRPQPS